MTPAELLRLLLDPDRLAVGGRAGVAPDDDQGGRRRHRAQASGSCSRRSATCARPGWSRVDGEHYEIDIAALRDAARAAADLDVPMDPIIGYGMTDDEQAILRRFFAGRTLTEIPANRAKRQVLLQRLALEFDVGRRYTEREVNEILFAFHPDWSTLRRYLVDEGFLDREHLDDQNWYWRAGGRVTDLPSAEPRPVASSTVRMWDTFRSVVRFRKFETDPVARRLRTAITVEDMRRVAKRRLPRGVFDYIDGGAEDERSLANNSAAFGRIEFCPNVLRDVSEIDVSTTLLGKPVSMPLVLAPTGYTRLTHSAGRARRSRGRRSGPASRTRCRR